MVSEEPNRKPEYAGMTVNERLFAAGLLETFDEAVRAGNRNRMIEILIKVEIEPDGAARTADSILAHPTRFGRL